MPAIRLVFNDLPESIPMPRELQHRRMEVILRPIEEAEEVSEKAHDPAERWTRFFSEFTRTISNPETCSRDDIYADRLR